MSRVLIVDDNEDNLFLFQEYLEDNAFDVLLARSGAEALKLLDVEKVDVIVLDIQMPGMDGFEVCQHLKGSEQTKNIPVIFITAKFQDVDSVATGLYLGASDYLYKPVEEKDLVERVQVVLGPSLSTAASTTDSVTGLPNTERMSVLLEESIESAQRGNKVLSLVLFEIGGLDAPGAPKDTEAAESRIAKILSLKIRQKDAIGHLADRQLLLLLPGSREESACGTAERLKSEVIEAHKGQPWSPDLRTGVLGLERGDERTADHVLRELSELVSDQRHA